MNQNQLYRGPSGKGPKIAAIGGGTGLSTMLRGLKRHTNNLTAIVTVADDGGGSGVLRQELGMLPPGDVRNCLEALANVEPLMGELLHYRFTEGSLKGQSFGNLFLAALNGISGGSFDQAVSRMSQVLAITGRVIPVTTSNVQLEAEFENGAKVLGESKIFYCKKREDCRIHQVRLLPEHPPALEAALEAIREADMILLGPGSLYTSIIPNLLVDGVAQAIAGSSALKVYIANVMTQEGETEGYTNADHIRAIFQHSLPELFHLCLVNSSVIPPEVLERYAQEGAEPLRYDKAKCAELGVELVSRPVSMVRDGYVRHDPELLAAALLELHAQRSVRIAGQGRYRAE
ncbi:MAG: YvcK family protein [Oscillospiraceae bacterium]|nr:YvcK family protein [Oscillospiraceae bacterium]